MSFRKYGGIRFARKNNFISSKNISPYHLTIGQQMGQTYSEIVCNSTLNMNGNEIINTSNEIMNTSNMSNSKNN